MATIITSIDPITLETQIYSPQDISLIPIESTPSNFTPSVNYIEYSIISSNKSFQITEYDFTNFQVINNSSPAGSSLIYDINLDPEQDLRTRGFTNGDYNVIYNFLNNELDSSSNDRIFYIKEISSDRTELKLGSNELINITLEDLVDEFKQKLNSSPLYFQDFYLNFGNNNLLIANNILVDNSKPQYEILINLYEPLPTQYNLKDTLWIVTQVADPLAFNIQFQPDVIIPVITNPTLKGPNLDLTLKDKINNSSNYINYEQLLTTGLASSYNQILSYLDEKSIEIGIDYTDFSNFVHFSSAQSRVENFYYKIQLIEQYNVNLTTLIFSTSSSISSSVIILEEKISNIIKNFDGYEYYLYYTSGSNAYPKGTDVPPYDLMASNSPQAISWYNDQIASALSYDADNKDYLINTIPTYLIDDPQNDPYKVFVNMVGQHYDNIWIYYKDVTNRYNGDNRLDYGISKDLVADALRSFGLKIYQNNFSTDNLFNAFAGFNFLPSGSINGLTLNGNVYITSSYIDEGNIGYFLDDYIYIPGDPTELITSYITASQTALYTPIDDVNKEIYKRLYHNLPLLLKQKGTVTGLRNLINVYGIPDTILRISEFGGRDKDTSTYDHFYEKYNLTAQTGSGTNKYLSTAWDLNTDWNATDDVPRVLQFRFKTNRIPTSNTPFRQGLWYLRNAPFLTSAIILTYTGSGYSTASYAYPDSGSNYSPEWQYAKLDFIPNILSAPNTSASIYLPFYDNNWWSVMVDRVGSTLTLYAGNKLDYNGYDGNKIGFIASASIAMGSSWTLGGSDSYFFNAPSNPYGIFTGDLQEIRYWARPSNVESFEDFIMNPSSIDVTNNEIESYANNLAFRLPLGNELYTTPTSIHPKITGSWVTTQSFASDSDAFIGDGIEFVSNLETFFLDSPIAGLRNRVNDKIQIVTSSLPSINLQYTQSGSILSQYRSIQQQYPSQGSETPDVNILEVAFSPQNEIDDDIISSLGYFNIGEYIGDPRQTFYPNYPDLNLISQTYFQKYIANYNLFDYIRLIKFFDNSLFKMIKDFVPARTNLRSGVVVKQHLLERSKYPQPQMEWEDVTYTGSIDTAFFSGSTGGTFNEFNTVSNGVVLKYDAGSTGGYTLGTYENIFFSSAGTNGSMIDNGYYTVISSGSSNARLIIPNQSGFAVFTITAGLGTVEYNFIISSSLNGYSTSVGKASGTPAGTYTFTLGPIFASPNEFLEVMVSTNGSVSDAIFSAYPYSKQTWTELTLGPTGSTYIVRDDQREFYNGELPGTIIEASNGELNEANIFKYPSTLEIYYSDILINSSADISSDFMLEPGFQPYAGAIFMWYDTGSTFTMFPGERI